VAVVRAEQHARQLYLASAVAPEGKIVDVAEAILLPPPADVLAEALHQFLQAIRGSAAAELLLQLTDPDVGGADFAMTLLQLGGQVGLVAQHLADINEAEFAETQEGCTHVFGELTLSDLIPKVMGRVQQSGEVAQDHGLLVGRQLEQFVLCHHAPLVAEFVCWLRAARLVALVL